MKQNFKKYNLLGVPMAGPMAVLLWGMGGNFQMLAQSAEYADEVATSGSSSDVVILVGAVLVAVVAVGVLVWFLVIKKKRQDRDRQLTPNDIVVEHTENSLDAAEKKDDLNLKVPPVGDVKVATAAEIDGQKSLLEGNQKTVSPDEELTAKGNKDCIVTAVNGGAADDIRTKEIADLKSLLMDEKQKFEASIAEKEELYRTESRALEMECANRLSELQHKNEALLASQREEYEAQLVSQQEKYEKQLASLREEHEAQLVSMKANAETQLADKQLELEALNKQVLELQGAIHVECDSFVQEIQKNMESITMVIDKLYESVSLQSGVDSLYANSVQRIRASFNEFKQDVNSSADGNWKDVSVRIDQVRKEMHEFIDEGLNYGWINIINYLNLYAGATAELNDSMNAAGLSTIDLSNLAAEAQRLAGLLGIKIIVPHLLTDSVADGNYSLESTDRRIQDFSESLNPKEYPGRIVDLSCVGYQIGDCDMENPKVYY